MHHLALRHHLDSDVLADIMALIEETTRLEGHPPVGEHKYAHLRVGARDWAGITALEDGVLVGYAHLRWNPGDGAIPRVAVEVVVHPDHQTPDPADGVAPLLLAEARRAVADAGGGTMWLWVHRVRDPQTTLAARMGFTVQRELAYMTRPLGAVDQIPSPEGVTVRAFRPGQDEPALLRVNNAAFAGHPENGNWDTAELQRRMRLQWFDPEGLFLAWRRPDLLGFHWTKWHGHAGERPPHDPVGEVYVLAVHPDAQGLGLGRGLLRTGLAHLAGRGCRRAILYVDRTSERAVALYAAEGFGLAYLDVCYEDHIAAGAGGLSVDLLRPS